MKLNIPTNILQEKLTFVNKAISPKSQIPILSNILIAAKENLIVIKSTDLEIGIEISIQCKIEEKGEVAIPARNFIELINTISDEVVTLETDKEKLIVSSKKTQSVFQTSDSGEFPSLFKEKGEMIANFQSNILKKDLEVILFASAVDTTRPALSGIMVKSEEGGFLLVATDGYRLSLKHHKSPTKHKKITESYIVPARVFKELALIKEEKEEVEVFISAENSQIIFTQNNTVLVGRLIDGTFPSYEKIIPSDYSTQAFYDRSEFLRAVKICSIFARESANIIKLSFQKDKIVVSSQSPQIGENTVTIDAVLKGEENEIAFNARYLQEILSAVGKEEMIFEMTGPLNPGVFKIKDDPSFLHLIMPVRVQV